MSNNVNVKLSVIDDATTKLRRVEGEISNFAKNVDNKFKGMAKAAIASFAGMFAISKVQQFARESIDLYKIQEKADQKLRTVLKSTGEAAGVTYEELKKMASGLQGVTTVGDETIQGAQHLLLTFTRIGKDVFPQATETVLDMAEAMGGIDQAALQVGKALNDPIRGVTALRRVGVQLTQQQEEQIKKFVEMGDITSAQKVILQELQTEFGGLARAMAETDAGKLQQMENKLGDLKETIGKEIIPLQLEWNSLVLELAQKYAGPISDILRGVAYMVKGEEKANAEKQKKLNAIGEEIKLLVELKKEQESIAAWNKGKNTVYNKEEYDQAVSNIEILKTQIKELAEESRNIAGLSPLTGNGGSSGTGEKKLIPVTTTSDKSIKYTGDAYGPDVASYTKGQDALLKNITDYNDYIVELEQTKQERLFEIQDYYQQIKIDSITDPVEREIAIYEQKYLKMEKMAQSDAEILAAIEKAKFAEWKQIEKLKQQTLVDNAKYGLSVTTNNLKAMADEWKEAGAAYKAFAITQAIIDTFASAQSSYKAMAGIPYVGPALGIAAAAVAVGAGMARVAQIRKQKFASGTMYAPGGYALVGEHGPETMYVPRGAMITNNRQTTTVTNNTQPVNVTIYDQSGSIARKFTAEIRDGEADELVRAITQRANRI